MLLETLCNTDGVSGNEDRIRNIILSEIRPYADDIKTDSMGNITAFKKGKHSDKKVMVCAHMDEVGFIVSGFTDKGYLKFKTVGGIDTRVIISKRVRTSGGVPGVIGMKAIHLQSPDERESVPKISSLFIDIGAKTKEEAASLVRLGEYVAFDTKYADFGSDKIKAKAIDDRVGCYALCEVLKHDYDYDLYAVFTVQEEVGVRGAQIASFRVAPDVCLVLESTTCADVYKTEPHEQVTVCGGGAALSIMDRASVSDRELLNSLSALAENIKIPVQYKKTTMGGNDAGAIHLSREGVKCVVASVPCRYLHSPVGVASKTDIKAVTDLAVQFCKNIGGLMKWKH